MLHLFLKKRERKGERAGGEAGVEANGEQCNLAASDDPTGPDEGDVKKYA